jgi:hypothetical protein
MKVYILVDENGKNVAATLDPGMAMDLLLSRLMDAGKVDPESNTFEAFGQTVIEVDQQELLDEKLLTDFEVNQLDTEGFVLL